MTFKSLCLAALLSLAGVAQGQPAAPTEDPDRPFRAAQTVLTRAELDRVTFARHVDKPPEDDAKELTLAARSNRTKYRPGEPIWLYLLLKNDGDYRELDMRFDLHRDPPMQVNSIGLHLERDGQKVRFHRQSHVWALTSNGVAQIQERDYYVTRFDLRRLAGELEPGKYVTWWNHNALRSNRVEFEIAGEPAAAPTAQVGQDLTILSLQESKLQNRTGQAPEFPLMTIEAPTMSRISEGRFGMALGTGVAKRYYPDLHAIPASDGRMKIDAKLTGGRRLTVQLTPVRAGSRMSFVDLHAYLIVPTPAGERDAAPRRARGMLKAMPMEVLTPERPLRINCELPQDWSQKMKLPPDTELSILVTTEDFADRLSGGARIAQRRQVVEAGGAQRWAGLLRSDALQLGALNP